MCLIENFHVCRIHGAQQRGQCKMPPSTSWRPCLRGRTTRITAYPARGTSSSGTLGRARDGSSVRLTSRSSCRVELLPEVSMAAEPESGLDTRGPCSRRGAVRPPAPLVALRISHHEMKEVQTTLPSYVEPFDWVTPRSPMHRVGSKGNPQLIVTVHGPYRATSGRGGGGEDAVGERRSPDRVGRPASPICSLGCENHALRSPCVAAVRSRSTSGYPVKPSLNNCEQVAIAIRKGPIGPSFERR